MSNYVNFDPKKHEDRKLFRIRTIKVGDTLASVILPADVSFDEAAMTPWLYYVEEDEAEEKD